jgi:membrane-bound acyltransferase YfiQ involved in biofilm formation
MVGVLLLAGCATALGVYLAGNETALTDWLQQARVPLLFWRLTLYVTVVTMWFHRVRATLLRQAPSRGVVYRIEVMMVCLALLIEFTSYRWGM